MRWAGYIVSIGEKRRAFCVGKPEGKRILGISKLIVWWENYI
jgi:hypothetical protein